MNIAQMKEVYNEFNNTGDHLKYTFFDFFKNKYEESSGAICVSFDLNSFGIQAKSVDHFKKKFDDL